MCIDMRTNMRIDIRIGMLFIDRRHKHLREEVASACLHQRRHPLLEPEHRALLAAANLHRKPRQNSVANILVLIDPPLRTL